MFCTLFDLSINIVMLFVRLRKKWKGKKASIPGKGAAEVPCRARAASGALRLCRFIYLEQKATIRKTKSGERNSEFARAHSSRRAFSYSYFDPDFLVRFQHSYATDSCNTSNVSSGF